MKTVGCGKSRDTKSTLLQPKNIKHLSNTSPDAGLKAIVEIYFKFHHPLQNTASATRFLQCINFAIEFKVNHEIPSLDVRNERNLNTFTTIVHRKTTFTGHYTKWDSFTPRKYKINLIRILAYRCLRICSSSSFITELTGVESNSGE